MGVAPLPDPPVGVTAIPMSSTRVDVTWSPPGAGGEEITGYRVYRDDDLVASVVGTRVSDAGLAPSTQYRYAVSAVNAAGEEGARSEAVTTTTPAETGPPPGDDDDPPGDDDPPAEDDSPPSRPGDPRATAVSGTQVNLTWTRADDPESDVASYRVYRDGTAIATVAAADHPSFSDTGLAPFTGYSYEVSAVNGVGLEGPRSGSVEVTTLDGSPPSAPGGLEAVVRSGREVALSWSEASDAESGISAYRVYRDGDRVASTSGATSFTDDGVEPGRTYAYEVSAVNGAGLEGPRGEPATVTTTDESPPSAPSGLSADVTNLFAVQLDWEEASDPESGISTYNVYRDGALRGTSDDTRFTDRDLTPWVTYTYVVTAVNGEGLEGPPTRPVSVRTISGDPDDGGGNDGDGGGGDGDGGDGGDDGDDGGDGGDGDDGDDDKGKGGGKGGGDDD